MKASVINPVLDPQRSEDRTRDHNVSKVKISVVIPTYNEQNSIEACLASLAKQTIAKKMEIIVVDDGSTDGSEFKIQKAKLQFKIQNLILLKQGHGGPGEARNLGASKASGEVMVFVDADMEFEPDFVEKLLAPIVCGKAVGTYSTQEYLLNKDKPLARCWNRNFGRSVDKMETRGYAQKASGLYLVAKNCLEKIEGKKADEQKNRVFRAILKSEFAKAGGFDTGVGYTDDWSISQKLNIFPVSVDDAVYFHRSPDNFSEIWRQARWFGKNDFLTRNIIRKLFNLWRYFPPWSIFYLYDPTLFAFKCVFNTAVFISVVLSFFGEHKAR